MGDKSDSRDSGKRDSDDPKGKGISSSGLGKKDFQVNTHDNPGICLVSKPLNGANYNSWSRAMRIALGAKKKYGFVTGKIKRPEIGEENYDDWEEVDLMVQSWILNSIEKSMSDNFLYCATSKEMWDTL